MLATIGYEKASLDHFIGTLQTANIDMLIDVRDRAQSRRKGFSKTALSQALAEAGIEYMHLRELGDPKPGREAARAGKFAKFRAIYNDVLSSVPAQEALAQIAELTSEYSLCLMCYERDHRECHRKMVSDLLESTLSIKTRHLGVQNIEPIQQSARRVLYSCEGAAA